MTTAGFAKLLADRWLLGLMAAGLGLRVGLAVWLDPTMLPRGDEGIYRLGARILSAGGDLHAGTPLHPPLYVVFLAGTKWLSGWLPLSWNLTTKLIQCVASVATAIPVYRTADRIGGRRVARIAAGFLLFDPTLIAFTHLLWPATIFLLVFAVICDVAPGLERRSNAVVVCYGMLFGLAMLLKSVMGLFSLFLAGWWLTSLGLRRGLRVCAVFGFAAFVVVAPWAVRNQLEYGGAILLENELPYNLWMGNGPQPALEILEEWRALGDPVRRHDVGLEKGWAAIVDDPGRFARNTVHRFVNLWGLEWFVVRHMVTGGYGPVGRDGFLAAFWWIQLAWGVTLVSAALGVARAWRDPVLRLVLGYIVVFTVIVSCMVAATRFRVPFAFALSICAALGIDDALSGRLDRRRLVPTAIALLVLSVSATRPLFREIAAGDYTSPSQLDDRERRLFRY